MGSVIEGKTYIKNSQNAIPVAIVKNVDGYKSKHRISSGSNLHFTQMTTSRRVVDDLGIRDENYDEFKYAVKRLPLRNKVQLSMIW